jgi:hypothetical protein
MATLACLVLFIGINTPALAEDVLPQPGQTIDKSNYETYKHLFPEEYLDAFTTGWGLIEPLSITIKESVPNPFPKVFLEASEKNRGKYDLDADGYITGGAFEEIVGFPFPDISPDDQNFAAKLMWNFDYRYQFDDNVSKFITFQKRTGSAVSTSIVESYQISFQNRMFDDPKPLYKTRNGLRSVNFLKTVHPPVQKNFITFLIRSIDQKAPDTTYIYLPSMRRVLRGEAGQRSTPINSSTQAPDDFQVFSGRIPEFNYKLVGEQKLIVLGDAKLGYTEMKGKKFDNIPVEKENWMLKDVYVIDIIPKDEKYPQGRKRIWIDKENYWAYYGAAYDRAGALWKVWHSAVSIEPMAGGGKVPFMKGMLGMDIQLGYATQMCTDWTFNGNGLTEADASVAAIRKNAR